jgi:hypothetical protein
LALVAQAAQAVRQVLVLILFFHLSQQLAVALVGITAVAGVMAVLEVEAEHKAHLILLVELGLLVKAIMVVLDN